MAEIGNHNGNGENEETKKKIYPADESEKKESAAEANLRQPQDAEVGFFAEVKMTRGTGTRDQETMKAKGWYPSREDAEADEENMVAYLTSLAKQVREIQTVEEEE